MIFTFLSLASLAVAAPGASKPNTEGFTNPIVQPSRGGSHAICVSGTVAVTASSQNLKLNYPLPANQSQVTNTFVEFVSDGNPHVPQVFGGQQNVSGTYNIGATLCTPATGDVSSIQFLTHGVGFDRYYWDFAPGYSYVDYAASQGYATFLYDRLGTGMSSKPDPIQTVQSPLEVAIAAQLIGMLRSGYFSGKRYTHVVGAGHSYGSVVTQALTAHAPTLLDAAVLTGFTVNSTGLSNFLSGLNIAIASQNTPSRFGSLNNGYLVASSAISNQIAFFRSPGYDDTILARAEASKETVTVGQLFTTTAVIGRANEYTGPVAIVNGDADLPFCLGNCTYPVDKSSAVQHALYPQAKILSNSVYVAPNTGHGINLHYSAPGTFKFIQDFVKSSGL